MSEIKSRFKLSPTVPWNDQWTLFLKQRLNVTSDHQYDNEKPARPVNLTTWRLGLDSAPRDILEI